MKLDWDEGLPRKIIGSWETLSCEFQGLSVIKLRRQVLEEDAHCDLHLFTDSSPKACGVTAYITNYETESQLLMSKARVASLKLKTFPHLVLTSVYLGAKLRKIYQRNTAIHEFQ